jgi:glucose uptake protein
MIGAFWGVFIWREFRQAPKGTSKMLGLMFILYLVGLAILITAKRSVAGQ